MAAERRAAEGDKAVVHALRGRASNRKLSEEAREKALAILARREWKGFGPTLASYHLAKVDAFCPVWGRRSMVHHETPSSL